VGLADTEPLVPNRDKQGVPIPKNQAENRRIVIRIQKQLPPRMGERGPGELGKAKSGGAP
jgi:chemotaxis protein MotB